jgi:hypothetical protein
MSSPELYAMAMLAYAAAFVSAACDGHTRL